MRSIHGATGFHVELSPFFAAALAGAGAAYLALSFTQLRHTRQLIREFEERMRDFKQQLEQSEVNAAQLVQDVSVQLQAKADLASRVTELQDALAAIGHTREMLELQLDLSEQARQTQACKLQRLQSRLAAMLEQVEAAVVAVASGTLPCTSSFDENHTPHETDAGVAAVASSKPAATPPLHAARCKAGNGGRSDPLDALHRMVEAGLAEARGVAVDEGSSSTTVTELSRSSSWDGGDDGFFAGGLEPLSEEEDMAAAASAATGRCPPRKRRSPPQEQARGEQKGDQDWAVGLGPCTPDVAAPPPPSRGGNSMPAPLWLGGGWAAPPPSPLQAVAAAASGGALPAAAATAAQARGYVCQVVARVELQGGIAAADGSVVTPRRQLQYAAELEAAGGTAAPAADAC